MNPLCTPGEVTRKGTNHFLLPFFLRNWGAHETAKPDVLRRNNSVAEGRTAVVTDARMDIKCQLEEGFASQPEGACEGLCLFWDTAETWQCNIGGDPLTM